MKYNKNSLIFKIALLSISTLLMIAPAVSSALPLLYPAFSGVSKASVEGLVTLPNIGIIFGLILSPILIKFLGQKKTVLSGLVLALISGTFPMYASNFMMIAISRLLLGVGIGLFNSLAVSLIPQFYNDEEEETASMLGFQNVMGALGTALASFVLSWLVTINWHMAFGIYLLIIPVFILFALFIPNDKANKTITKKAAPKNREKINSKLVVIWTVFFILFIFYMPISYKLPLLVTSEKLGSMSQYAALTGITGLCGIPLGASLGMFFKKLHDKIFPLGFLITALGFLLFGFATNLVMIFAGNIVLGFGAALAIPYLYNWISWAAPHGSVNLATTIALVLINIACSISPYILNSLSGLLGNSTPRFAMFICAAAFILLTVYGLGHYLRVHRVNIKAKQQL